MNVKISGLLLIINVLNSSAYSMSGSDVFGEVEIPIREAIVIVEMHFKDMFLAAKKQSEDFLDNRPAYAESRIELKDFFVSSVSLAKHYVKPFDPEQVKYFDEYKWVVVVSHRWRTDRYYVFVVGADGKPKLILQIV